MSDAPDAELLEQFARNQPEDAFAALVQRHIGMVHSVALRHTANPEHAQDITQAVFIILARKAGSLGPKTVLAGWLYHTARLTAANFQRAEMRRIRREQEAFMQSTLEEPASDALWRELSPLLDDAMAQLRISDRDAIVLRFFQNRSLADVGASMGIAERAAQKRINRALEKLRKFFAKRGIASTTAIIAGVISAYSVQATPAALAKTISAVATAKGVTATTSTLTLVKGAMKIMAWTKLKTSAAVCLGIALAAGTTTITVQQISSHDWGVQTQKLADGSILTLESVDVGHHALDFSPDALTTSLTAKFKLSGAKPDNPLLADYASLPFRPCRVVISGQDGFEYATLLWRFSSRSGNDQYGQVNTCFFPRDSRKLRIQIQHRDAADAPWITMAEFTHRQRIGKEESWQPEAAPISRNVDGMRLNVGQVTLHIGDPSALPGDEPWKPGLQSEGANELVVIPWQLLKDGLPLTNWILQDPILRDSSGNAGRVGYFTTTTNGWTFTRITQSPDPRKVWKIQAQLAENSGFDEDNVFIIHIPIHRGPPFETNVDGYPFRIQFFNNILSTELLLTNRTDLRLNFLHAQDQSGQNLDYNRIGFTQYVFQMIVDLRAGGELAETFAIGKNIPIEFVTKPQIINSGNEE